MVFEMFSDKLQELIKSRGFTEPTLTQKVGVPEIMKGSNILIIAPTGTGKTETTCLPLFDKIAKDKNPAISMLYINPLRSLSRDLLDRLVWWADKLDLEIGVRHGDVGQKERAMQREVPPHILITTPETLGAILPGKVMQKHLANVKYVVIDEIHELVESKRGVQLTLLLERLRNIAGDFQRIGLSATVGTPEKVAAFLGKDVKVVRAETEKRYDIRVENPTINTVDKKVADDLFTSSETISRLRRLYDLVVSHTSVLTFTNTRETAEVLSSRLRSLDKELKHDVHHGSLSKEKRIKAEQLFKRQELKSLIATSSLELGIDIGSIDLVIQYLSPRQVGRLIQRVGRAGHKVGEVSKGVVISGGEDLFESTVIVNKAMRRELEPVKIHEMAFDVLAAQIVGYSLDKYDVTSEELYSTIKNAYPYTALTKKDLMELLRFMESLHLVWLNETADGYAVKRRKNSWDYYFGNLSTIPVTSVYKVISVIEGEPIGSLDESFIAEHGQPGEKFVCSGRPWKIIQVENRKVMVEPIEDIESAVPAWEGELIPVPFDVAQEVGMLRKLIAAGKDAAYIQEKFRTDVASAKEMMKIIEKQGKTHTVPDHQTLLIERYNDFCIIHACFGSHVNETIGRYLAAKITERTGVSVNMKIDPYRIILQSLYDSEQVKRLLVENEDFEDVVMRDTERSSAFKWRFLQVARRFGIISRDVNYDKINLKKLVAQYVGTPVYKESMRELVLDKMNVSRAKEVLSNIQEGKIRLISENGLSYLGELGLLHQFSDVMKPTLPKQEIFKAFAKRLLTTRVRLLCTNCADYTIVTAVKSLDERPVCPKCGSQLIAVLRKGQIQVQKILKKRLKKKDLGADELKHLEATRRSADLVAVYGRRAAFVLAGRGIGPQTAARILARLHPTKEKLLRDILEAEKNFVRTKKYWK